MADVRLSLSAEMGGILPTKVRCVDRAFWPGDPCSLPASLDTNLSVLRIYKIMIHSHAQIYDDDFLSITIHCENRSIMRAILSHRS